MTLEEKILNDFNQARKSRDEIRASTLSFLRAQMKNLAIEKRKDSLDDGEVLSVIKKLVKQREDSIEQFKKGKRDDLADKETKEKGILTAYLPQALSQGELKKVVDDVIKELGVADLKGMGNVMKEVSARTQGRADNRMLSEIVRQALGK
ncbi:MAG: GatB/YqeY domain-containing protein [Candidatus Omnitrophica bacterium]|nr:GatB/YqeY domain-containing protein [Candidatus Omnitrophota bacterium]